ncbi:MAG: TIGR03364 family FAD-dependent oxidoreductase [Ferruginibacter sp.]|nr:TIGR03364 family FAD-dependent oxidoreductase [Chitinophagaceae bacterium]
MHKSAIVIGGGIVGLATARALGAREYKVTVIERTQKAVGASIRNFGMIWPIGQPGGKMYERAMLSRGIWTGVCKEAKIWYEETGSLHTAYHKDEWKVLEEFNELTCHQRNCHLLSARETIQSSEAVVAENLLGSLFSEDEMIVDPREAMEKIPAWLTEKYGVRFIWGKAVTTICYPEVYTGKEVFAADEIYVCSGADFETLYPEIYTATQITKCKLQMLRLAAQPGKWRLGPALCGGLSLVHYKSFASASSLALLTERFEKEYPDYLKWGIHVMVAQNQSGELTAGDSHEYGLTHDPFDRQFINQLILDYLKTFARFGDETIIETWNGIYPKLTNGNTELVVYPESGVTIINGLGGAGMTLSFGLCEQLVSSSY